MTTNQKISFVTNCWEKDWEILLKQGRLDKMISKNNFQFSKKILTINNVKDRKEVTKWAEKAKSSKIIDEYFFTEDTWKEVLIFFDIPLSFKEERGFLYSIAEYTALFFSKEDYMVFFTGDSILEKKDDWITKALQIFKENDDIVVINPLRNNEYKESGKECAEENDIFFKGFLFSDQCFMIPVQIFREKIYGFYNKYTDEIFPKYAGESFEKRSDAFMRTKKLYRATLKNVVYLHINFKENLYIVFKFKIKMLLKKFIHKLSI